MSKSMWQIITFKSEDFAVLDEALLSLSEFATCEPGTAFYFFKQLPGQPEFSFDCEFIDSGLITSRSGDYFKFLGHFLDTLTVRFGALEMTEIGKVPPVLKDLEA